MAIVGLIILDAAGHPIIQSAFRAAAPAFPLLHIDAYNAAARDAARPADVDPVLYVPHAPGPPSACCHRPYADVRFLCPVSGDADPLVAFAFLQAFIDILHDYFGTVSASTLKDNFDVVYQLLEETLDASGHPLTTAPNALRDIVLPPSLLSKLLAATGAALPALGAPAPAAGAFASPIPWRTAGVRHASNEVYFDIVETLRATASARGTLACTVWGRIDANAKLSGTPDLLLTFANAPVLADCAFHPCVRLQRWARDKALSFVPPDGRFVLLEYRVAPPASVAAPAITGGRDNIPLPLAIKGAVTPASHGGTLDLTLTTRLSTRALENVVVELFLGAGATGAQCEAARAGTGGVRGDAGERGATWAYDPRTQVLRWEVPRAPPASSWTLRGSFASTAAAPRPARAVQIRGEIPQHTFSALKVDQLKVTSEAYKPYKGVRGRSEIDIEWRL